jgi:DNA-binding MarR family transcriptional regulator
MVGLLTASIGSGQLITRFGRYKPFPVAGTAIMVVGLFLLSRLQVDTPTVVTGAYMLVLGFGLGNVIQVLVLAAQNAVDYKYLGVASSGSTLFRQIGGSIGVSVFGAIFANQLAANLVGKLPLGARVPSSAANPAVVKQLPAVLRDPFRIAITDALTTVFLVAAGIAVLAFLLTWLLPEVPLKTTAGAPDPGDGLHPARDDDALREIERALSSLARREERWQLYERLAARAGLELGPPELWLLARLGERTPLTEAQLDEQLPVDSVQIARALEQLERRSLVQRRDGGPIELTAPGREDYERLVTARCDGLRELLNGWDPDEHSQLRELIDQLGRDLVSEIPELRPPAPPATADERDQVGEHGDGDSDETDRSQRAGGAAPQNVGERADRARPGAAAEGVPEQEARPGHPVGAGQPRRNHPEARQPAARKRRRPRPSVRRTLHRVRSGAVCAPQTDRGG